MLTKTIKVKDGMIMLPKDLQKAWKDAYVSVHTYRDKVVLEGPAPQKRKYNLAVWKKAAGILKHKRIPDPVEWQRKIRNEWDRNIA